MVTLYEHPLSPYAQKVKISAREKGVELELRTPDGIGAGNAQGEFASANPRAEVPALIDGDVYVFDSTIILEYLEDKWPEPAMLPATPAARARVRMIEEVCDTHYEAINWGLGEIAYFRRATGSKAKEMQEAASRQTAKIHTWLTKQLGKGDWFNGGDFGWGDLSVVPYVNGSAGFGNAPDEGSPLGKWLARVNARPSVAKTAKEAVDSITGMQQVANILEQGLFKREYRDHRLEWMMKTDGVEIVLNGLEKDNIRFSYDFE
ncbi:glutathione S-transferase family protein [Parvibaculum sp.]|uniref:glutathione S-transferase family protein n=1 Tax=Parvibaculum sp. TaxID=2024848 RepID=UPI001B1FC677|nr:glutathione S-transferase family protein [Parvibaculum sp.]MBO6634482.1 glutathione S-transferase family protein [Parvibaculum sp.]MBO6677055.1 glutathione S-transferase family protein [Parvibaculum sp.]MBO6686476.1 glutathione S-transferase family protein [Parvibaculum sp.]MBO6904370.1 glutathione S-transferase family protein [Parvibaculum sp.]